jgi:hypothetical protein
LVVDGPIDVSGDGPVRQAIGNPQQRIGDIDFLVEVQNADIASINSLAKAGDRERPAN